MQDVAVQYNMLQEQRQLLLAEMDKLSRALVELNTTKSSISSLKKGDSMFSIGSNVFVPAEIKEEYVLFPIGASLIIKLSYDEALKRIDKRIELLTNDIKKLNIELKKIEDSLLDIQKQVAHNHDHSH